MMFDARSVSMARWEEREYIHMLTEGTVPFMLL